MRQSVRQSGRITFDEVNFEDDVDDFVKGVMGGKADLPIINEEEVNSSSLPKHL